MPMGIGPGLSVTRGGSVTGIGAIGADLALWFDENQAYKSSGGGIVTPDSILTYTAPSPKMVYGSDGVLGYAPHNLLTYSEQFNESGWLKDNCTVSVNAVPAPDGTTTAEKLIMNSGSGGSAANNAGLRVALAVSGGTYTYSIYAKAGEFSTLRVRENAETGAFLDVNLTNGAISNGSSAQFVSPNALAVGNGWYRVSWASPNTMSNVNKYLFRTSNVGDGTSGILIWGAQLNLGSSALTYIPTTTAAVYSLPRDHNPTTGAALGVLVEEARTNLLTYSEQFDNAAWVKSGLNTTATPPYINVAVSPDGTQNADFMIEDTANSQHIARVSASMAATTAHTYSFFAKAAGRTNIVTNRFNSSVVPSFAHTFTLSGSGTSSGGQITALANGWYRCSGSFTTTGAGVGGFIVLLDDGTGTTYTGDGTSGIYIWGAQLEAGAFATSYIPTVASQVTRAADQVSILTSAFPWTNTAMAAVMDFTPTYADDGAAATFIAFTFFGGATNYARMLIDTSGSRTGVPTAGVRNSSLVAIPAAISYSPGTQRMKWAMSYDSTVERGSYDANTLGTEAAPPVTLPTPTTLWLGGSNAGATPINGHIKRFAHYASLKSQAELNMLTAL
jgi:hypothetical protein